MVLVARDNYSGYDIEEVFIIKTDKALNAFYSRVNRTRKPGLSIPKIDFSKEMVVVWSSGEQKNGFVPSLKLLKEAKN